MEHDGVILSNWHTLINDFSTSGREFYQAVEATLRERGVPGVTFERRFFKEGGLFTAKREFLRVERDRVAFDIYAAPYGTGFFFSWWLSQLRPKHPWLYRIAVYLVVILVPQLIVGPFDPNVPVHVPLIWLGSTVVLAVIGLAFLARRGLLGSERRIMRRPLIGRAYKTLFTPVTYYTHDTALLFQESVRRVVNDVIDGLLTSQGLRALSEEVKQPVMGDAGLHP